MFGGHPASINPCHAVNLDDVSRSPFPVPIARIAHRAGRARQPATS